MLVSQNHDDNNNEPELFSFEKMNKTKRGIISEFPFTGYAHGNAFF